MLGAENHTTKRSMRCSGRGKATAVRPPCVNSLCLSLRHERVPVKSPRVRRIGSAFAENVEGTAGAYSHGRRWRNLIPSFQPMLIAK